MINCSITGSLSVCAIYVCVCVCVCANIISIYTIQIKLIFSFVSFLLVSYI